MKTILLLATLLSSSAFAATLKIPLFVELEDYSKVPVSKINELYKLQGKDKLLEVLVVSDSSESQDAARTAYWDTHTKVLALADKVSKSFFLATDRPGGISTGTLKTCYTGTPAAAVGIAGLMTDSIYSDQMGIFGYKHKNSTVYVELEGTADEDDFLSEQSPLWKNWSSKNDDVLILVHEGDGGDDVNEGVIVKCR